MLPLAGEPLVVWVARRVQELHLTDRLVVATDAAEIAAAVERAGFEAVMTSAAHQSGTERIAEVVAHKDFSEFDLILNVQGDEPFVKRSAVEGAVRRLRTGDPIATAAGTLDPHLATDPNRVKVVVGPTGHAVYFSRAPIPYGEGRGGTGKDEEGVRYRQHVGVYGYTREALACWVALAPMPEERWERLEQLRPLLHGIPIGVALFDEPPAPGIDTPEDLRWAEAQVAGHVGEVSP